jgi:hypothetical protein
VTTRSYLTPGRVAEAQLSTKSVAWNADIEEKTAREEVAEKGAPHNSGAA